MKFYIENQLENYSSIYPQGAASVVEHMFAVLGNGVDLNNKGFLNGNYGSKQCYEFGDPVALAHIYPWSDTERFQPFRDLAGCRDVGFKDTAKYFIDCVEKTPRDSIEYINEWLDNIGIVKEVLLDTPAIEDEFTFDAEGMAKFLDKVGRESTTGQNPVDPSYHTYRNSVEKRWFFDVQWTDCPKCVEGEVCHLWRDYELGNDNYLWKATVGSELFDSYPQICLWLRHKGAPEGEEVIIHWWW